MTVALKDFRGKETEVDIGNIDLVYLVCMNILSGDEMMIVYYKDGSTKKYDSSDCRTINYDDGSYVVYNPVVGVNLFKDEAWLSREHGELF